MSLLLAPLVMSQDFKPFDQAPGALSPGQTAALNKVIDLIACVLVCEGNDWSSMDVLLNINFKTDKNAAGGFITYPDKSSDPSHPFSEGSYEGSNGGDPGKAGNGNPIGVDPGSFTDPGAGGETSYCPGSGPNVNGAGGAPGAVPGSNSPVRDLGAAAGMLYGEIAHQDLGCKYDKNGGPATAQDLSNLQKSEKRVYTRAAYFYAMLADCDSCWSSGLTAAQVTQMRAIFNARSKAYFQQARKF